MNSQTFRVNDLSGGVHYFVKVMNAERNNHAGVAEKMHVLCKLEVWKLKVCLLLKYVWLKTFNTKILLHIIVINGSLNDV